MYSGVPIIWAKPVNSVLSVSSCPSALATPKSITLTTGVVSCSVTRTLDGLRSRWMIPFWWACCTAWQTGTNSSSRCRGVRWFWSQNSVIGHALDQLHDEVGPARVACAAVEHLGDVGMVHDRQRLPLGLEAGDHLPRVHARLEDLQGHLAADRLRLLGHEDDAEAAFADLLQQLVRADHRAGAFGDRRLIDGGSRRRAALAAMDAAHRHVGLKELHSTRSAVRRFRRKPHPGKQATRLERSSRAARNIDRASSSMAAMRSSLSLASITQCDVMLADFLTAAEKLGATIGASTVRCAATPARKPSADKPLPSRCRGLPRPGPGRARRNSGA